MKEDTRVFTLLLRQRNNQTATVSKPALVRKGEIDGLQLHNTYAKF